jgi:serine/threonine protein kinase
VPAAWVKCTARWIRVFTVKFAIKMLPAAFAQHTDRLRRFEQEARTTSALNHPNILTAIDAPSHSHL